LVFQKICHLLLRQQLDNKAFLAKAPSTWASRVLIGLLISKQKSHQKAFNQ